MPRPTSRLRHDVRHRSALPGRLLCSLSWWHHRVPQETWAANQICRTSDGCASLHPSSTFSLENAISIINVLSLSGLFNLEHHLHGVVSFKELPRCSSPSWISQASIARKAQDTLFSHNLPMFQLRKRSCQVDSWTNPHSVEWRIYQPDTSNLNSYRGCS